MNHDSLIEDVLSYLPDWDVKPEDEEGHVLEDYEHSYGERILEPSDGHKDQLYVAKYLTKKEVIQEFKRTVRYMQNYTHRERLPEDIDIYDGICKYTAGSLYLKYNLTTKEKAHGYALRKEAIALIEPYVIIKAEMIPPKKRHIAYPKWFNNHYPTYQGEEFHNPDFYEDGHHCPRRPKSQIRHKKPFIMVITFQKIHSFVVETRETPRYSIDIITFCARKRSKCNSWYARSVKQYVPVATR